MTKSDLLRGAVLGETTMGVTLANAIASGGRPCTLWCRDADVARAINESHRHPRFFRETNLASALVATTDMEVAVRDAAAIIVSVPSSAFTEVAKGLGRISAPNQLLLSSTKGLDPGSCKRMSELLREHTSALDVGAIGGANITPDIMAGQLTALLVATSARPATDLASRLLSRPRLPVYASEDLVGLEYVSVLKNVASVAVGIAIGLGLGINTISFVVTRAFGEVRNLAVALGAAPATLLDLCGIGDLFLTCTHPGSLNRQLAMELGKGRKLAEILRDLPEVPEGINAVRAAVELARRNGVSVPIAAGVAEIIDGSLPAAAIEELVVR